MTDYFALLDQPRRPWLDPEKLKQSFHEKSRTAHPDAGGGDSAFAALNEAYQVLRDPKRRLHHLLSLEGNAPSAVGGTVAPEIAELFQAVAEATQEADGALQKISKASNQLGRSLLEAELRQARARVDEARMALQELNQVAETDLRTLSESAANEDRRGHLERLYFRFVYLTRWIEQLEEKGMQLGSVSSAVSS